MEVGVGVLEFNNVTPSVGSHFYSAAIYTLSDLFLVLLAGRPKMWHPRRSTNFLKTFTFTAVRMGTKYITCTITQLAVLLGAKGHFGSDYYSNIRLICFLSPLSTISAMQSTSESEIPLLCLSCSSFAMGL